MLKKLQTFEEAKQTIENSFKPSFLGKEEVILLEAYNRVLAQNIVSSSNIPSSNNSRIAGYAVKTKDTTNANEEQPATFKVIYRINTGETPKASLQDNEAMEITAGEALPDFADTVISIMDTQRENEILHVYNPAIIGENIHEAGSDFKAGSVIFKKGQVLGPSEVGVLAALGLNQVSVLKTPIVAVLSIAPEIINIDKQLLVEKSRDPNGYSISTAVTECGAKPVYFGVSPEDKTIMTRLIKTAISSSDMAIICTDSTSAVDIIDSLGKPGIEVNGIAIKPGKRSAAAFIDSKPVFVFPTDPPAALLMYQLFVRTLVQRLGGRPTSSLKTITAVAGSKFFSAKGSRTFTLVQLSFDEQCRLIADPTTTQGTISALAAADGYVEIGENEKIEINQEVTVHLFRGSAGKT